MDPQTQAFSQLLTVILVIVIVIAVIRAGVRSGMKDANRAAATDSKEVSGGPGRYRVQGVDRATKMDTTWHCTADSPENARAKGELEGIYVTTVTEV